MKTKLFITTLIATLMLNVFCGCKAKTIDTTGKIKICTTIFPEYDWVSNITGSQNNDVILTLLIKNGMDIHSYQPTVNDIMDISKSDLFIYVGGESDKWIEDTLQTIPNKNLKTINLMKSLKNLYEEEDGIEEAQNGSESEEEEETEYDEHVWLSLKNAKLICNIICDELCTLDPKNQELYKSNCNDYLQKLNSLDEQFEQTVKISKSNTIIVCDRFPFLYMINDYNLKYFAAFKGCNSESQASFNTILTLSDKLNELNLNNIIVTESSDKKLANTVISTAKKPSCNIIALDSMQSTTLADIFNGKTYLKTMETNLGNIRKALN